MGLDYEKMECDVLVIGGGGAGARAALEAARAGARVILASKGPLGRSGLTPTANGGYQVPFQEDSPQAYFADQVRLGHGLNDERLVKVMTEEALPRLKELENMGARVSWRVSHFEPTLTYPRSVLIPGKVMMATLRQALMAEGLVKMAESWLVTRLLVNEGGICGALILDWDQGRLAVVQCPAVVLATGGLGELYLNTADSPMGVPTGATGEGCWLAAEVGAELVDMEMIQFVVIPLEPRIMWGMRHLPWGPFLNARGEEFIEPGEGPYSPLAARQVVEEMLAGRGPVYIDLSDKPYRSAARHPLAKARDRALYRLGLTPYQGRVHVGVGSLFTMGGIRINERCETTVPGLYAAGETAANAHGARRMAGNAFPEIMVFGCRAGKYAAEFAAKSPLRRCDGVNSQATGGIQRIERLLASKAGSTGPRKVKRRLQAIMEQYVQVLRNEEGLNQAEQELRWVEEELLPEVSVAGSLETADLAVIEGLTLPSMVKVARMIVAAAKARRESRGAHYRTDYPEEEAVPRHTRLRWLGGGPVVDMVPVEKINENCGGSVI